MTNSAAPTHSSQELYTAPGPFNPTHAVDGRMVYNFAVAAASLPQRPVEGFAQVHLTFTKADATRFSPLCHIKSHAYVVDITIRTFACRCL